MTDFLRMHRRNSFYFVGLLAKSFCVASKKGGDGLKLVITKFREETCERLRG